MLYLLLFALLTLLMRQIKTSLKYLHIMQLEGYKSNEYFGWLKKNAKSVLKTEGVFVLILGGLFLLLYLIFNVRGPVPNFLGALVAVNIFVIATIKKVEYKKPLVYTRRLIRLLITTLFVTLIELGLVFLVTLTYIKNPSGSVEFYIPAAALLAVNFLVPLNVLSANIINYPVELLSQLRYKRSARQKVESFKGLKVIGLTGSYGKTSTKNFLNIILSEKYNVLMTPASFNTPMGLCRVIREQLDEKHQVFIAEMGARYHGDIKELCDIVKPSIGIITSIGPQHLETFKTVEKIADTKFELIEALPENGFAVLNADDEWSMKKKSKSKVKTAVYSVENSNTDIFASDIKFSSLGTSFVLNDSNGNRIECVTKLLGKHNVDNILAAAAVALELGLKLEQIRSGISKLEPVEHRLQIVPTNNGVTVIDDAFNSNPVGSRMALDVIKTFTGNKIIVTPGMVELGEREFEYNKEFGRHIGETCDYAILVGPKRVVPIAEGINDTGFPNEKVIIVKSLNEATQKLASIVKPGDVVLFENDLPDNYNE